MSSSVDRVSRRAAVPGPEQDDPAGTGTSGRRRRQLPSGWIFVGPAAVFFAIFFAYPIIASFIMSFQTREAGEMVFAGIDNYARLAGDPIFRRALFNTMLVLFVQVPVMLVLAMLLAVMLNSSLIKARGTFRVIYFLPALVSLVAYAIVFRILLNTDAGLVNQFLGAVGLPEVDWLNRGWNARFAMIASMTWRWTGFNMVILLAGLQGISQDVYEAARTDGAGPVDIFFRITLPLMRPIILFCAVLSTIGTLQLFDEPFVLTGGGPSNATLTLVLYLYQQAFQSLNFGYASAIAYVIVLFVGILSFLQFKFLGRGDVT
ncbi:carbohydrate ABC transporter permease [Egicoccus halophilus]|nr:sugar ABC transporter permease [Egicoccus halophilus]